MGVQALFSAEHAARAFRRLRRLPASLLLTCTRQQLAFVCCCLAEHIRRNTAGVLDGWYADAARLLYLRTPAQQEDGFDCCTARSLVPAHANSIAVRFASVYRQKTLFNIAPPR